MTEPHNDESVYGDDEVPYFDTKGSYLFLLAQVVIVVTIFVVAFLLDSCAEVEAGCKVVHAVNAACIVVEYQAADGQIKTIRMSAGELTGFARALEDSREGRIQRWAPADGGR